MSKITYSEYLQILHDLEVTDEEILNYSVIDSGRGAFDIRIRPNPEKVELGSNDVAIENALAIGNKLSRWRRQGKFQNRLAAGDKRPIIASEGDSWFQFPFLVDDVIDHLTEEFNVFSLGAAGDTANNMVFGDEKAYHKEYMFPLREHKDRIRAFLFSGAGNDIIGEDRNTKKPVLLQLVKNFNGDVNDIQGHIEGDVLDQKIAFLRKAYSRLIEDIRDEEGFESLPIIVHGYDYAYPYPWKDDTRDPSHAKKDKWLGSAFSERNIIDPHLRRGIIISLIDRLYTELNQLAGDSQQTGVWVVDCRGSLPNVTDWIDEIHGTSSGFREPAKRIRNTLNSVLGAIT
ncbi:hypothetical protein N9850_04070 [Granulosicoccus sp.]|nr:hypothetical protein [Granulosicoccus sp.]MDB4222925.1 hypothetical protein [Granulosicoccus sp.]